MLLKVRRCHEFGGLNVDQAVKESALPIFDRPN
jgi:hypothetical protein